MSNPTHANTAHTARRPRGAVWPCNLRLAPPCRAGELKRTPIWRAAWNDHTDVIQVLLEAGADPRIMCQNQRAHSVCSVSVKASVFDQWNIERTDSMKVCPVSCDMCVGRCSWRDRA